MDEPIYCQIQVKGHLSGRWRDWLGGFKIENLPGGQTLLCGMLDDQTALYGMLNRIRDLGLFLISLECVHACRESENEKSVGVDDVRYRPEEK